MSKMLHDAGDAAPELVDTVFLFLHTIFLVYPDLYNV